MNISSASGVTGGGLERTADAIRRGQQDFDRKADDLVRSTQTELPGAPQDALAPQQEVQAKPKAEPQEQDTARAAVSFREQALVNQILYQTFRAQADQQRDLTKALPGA